MHKPIINRSDLQLLKLLSGYSPLRRKLSAAFAVAPHNVPANVVTMNSKLTYREETDDMSKSVKLVYPAGRRRGAHLGALAARRGASRRDDR